MAKYAEYLKEIEDKLEAAGIDFLSLRDIDYDDPDEPKRFFVECTLAVPISQAQEQQEN